jgi:predicted GNAT family N-acyltransferase
MNALNKPAMAGAVAATYRAPVEITVARTLSDIMQIVAVRAVVYMSEQDCPFHEEYDGNDFGGATHLIARVEGEPVGVLRLRWFADFAKLERLAVLREHRGGRTTFMLIDAAFDLAARKGYRKIAGHAQPRLVPFWIRKYNGRIRSGRPTFVFSDYEYTEVEADLVPPADAVTIDTDPMVLLRPEGEWDRPGVLDRSAARAKGFM